MLSIHSRHKSILLSIHSRHKSILLSIHSRHMSILLSKNCFFTLGLLITSRNTTRAIIVGTELFLSFIDSIARMPMHQDKS